MKLRPGMFFRNALLGLFFATVTGCGAGTESVASRSEGGDLPIGGRLGERLVDLTHPFDADTVVWPTSRQFSLEPVFVGENPKGFHYEAYDFAAPEHGGTHLDAPIHFFAGRDTVDAVPLDRLVGNGALVDVTEQCAADRDYQVSVEDLLTWESQNGSLDDKIVLLHTGFGRYWPDREKYMGTAERGEEAVAKLHFPGLDPAAATWLVTHRAIKAIGLDTPSIDYGQSQLYESHVTLFEHNVPAFENLANLNQLPPSEFLVVALPMKIAGGSGAPLRAVAFIAD